jgi:hypothetical protein
VSPDCPPVSSAYLNIAPSRPHLWAVDVLCPRIVEVAAGSNPVSPRVPERPKWPVTGRRACGEGRAGTSVRIQALRDRAARIGGPNCAVREGDDDSWATETTPGCSPDPCRSPCTVGPGCRSRTPSSRIPSILRGGRRTHCSCAHGARRWQSCRRESASAAPAQHAGRRRRRRCAAPDAVDEAAG